MQLNERMTFKIPTLEISCLNMPDRSNVKNWVCYARVTDLPEQLGNYMKINPRVPNRNKKGVLNGTVTKNIMTTLCESQKDMAYMNRGIIILAENVIQEPGQVKITLSDCEKHGIIDGGHTYTAIQQVIKEVENDSLEDDSRKNIGDAFVKLNIFQNVEDEKVPKMAEGLNRSKEVDDTSLENLKGSFDLIKDALKHCPYSKKIIYHQGEQGEIEILDILVMLNFFDCNRFNEKKHPYDIFRRIKSALNFYSKALNDSDPLMHALIKKLPDILWLVDSIRLSIPPAANKCGIRYGNIKIGKSKSISRKTKLTFIDNTVDYNIPNSWAYPILAAFRANLSWNSHSKELLWRTPYQMILPHIIDDLVGVLVKAHKTDGITQREMGYCESIYSQCYDKVQIYLAKHGLL